MKKVEKVAEGLTYGVYTIAFILNIILCFKNKNMMYMSIAVWIFSTLIMFGLYRMVANNTDKILKRKNDFIDRLLKELREQIKITDEVIFINEQYKKQNEMLEKIVFEQKEKTVFKKRWKVSK